MPIKLILNIDNVADLMGTAAYGTAARAVVYRGTALGDTAYAAAGTVSFVSGTDQYEWWDSSGTTSSWYKYRITDGTGVVLSSFSDEFRATALASYASLDALLERLDLPDEGEYNLRADILEHISAQLDAETGRQFYREPQVSGESTRTYDGHGGDVLYLPEGVTSLSAVELADYTGGAYTALGTADWYLRPSYPTAGWPYTELHLYGYAFPEGFNTVRLTGVFGWAAVPKLVEEAVLQLAARTYHESKTRHAGVAGMPELGAYTVPIYRPDAWHRAVGIYSRRVVV